MGWLYQFNTGLSMTHYVCSMAVEDGVSGIQHDMFFREVVSTSGEQDAAEHAPGNQRWRQLLQRI